MKYCLAALLILSNVSYGQELLFGTPSIKAAPKKTSSSLQILSTKSLSQSLDIIESVPEKYRSGMEVYQIGGYYVTRYINIPNKSSLQLIIDDFKKAGFTSLLAYKHSPKSAPLTLSKTSIQRPSATSSLQVHTPALSQHEQTKLIIDAQLAYAQRDFSQATIYYEMMVAGGINDRPILLNLCYLYGREGSSVLMEKLIEGKRGINDYLYAYGVGALEAGRSDLYSALSPHLIYDKSGKLAMLCGYFFEQEKNTERSKAFYTMAYEFNPSDPHILYAYARSVDMSGDKEKAIYLYTQISQLGSEFESLQLTSRSRIQALRNQQ